MFLDPTQEKFAYKLAYLKASLRRKRDLNQSLVLCVAQAMKGATNLKRHFAEVFVIRRHPLFGK